MQSIIHNCDVPGDRRADLDGLRGIAILLTIFLHYVSRGGYISIIATPEPIANLLDSFWSGVDIFFVLSGFLIGGIILDNRHAENFFQVFYLRRALRILPVALMTIALAYIALPNLGVIHPQDNQVPLFAYLAFINNLWTANGVSAYPPLGPMWSLAIEEQFYLLAPVLILISSTSRWMAITIAVILVSPMARLINFGVSSWDFTLFRLDGFSIGMLCAILLRSEKFTAYATKNRARVSLAIFTISTATILFSMSSDFYLHQRIAFGISLNSLATAGVIVYMTINAHSSVTRALSSSWLVALGRRSYFLYLFHMPSLLYIGSTALPRTFKPVAALLLCLIGAWLSWRYIEEPLIRIGKRKKYITIADRNINGMESTAIQTPS